MCCVRGQDVKSGEFYLSVIPCPLLVAGFSLVFLKRPENHISVTPPVVVPPPQPRLFPIPQTLPSHSYIHNASKHKEGDTAEEDGLLPS